LNSLEVSLGQPKSFYLNGREVEIEGTIEVGEGFWIESAWFTDPHEEGEREYLNDEQIDEIDSLYQDDLYQNAYENLASHAYDMAKDRWKYGE